MSNIIRSLMVKVGADTSDFSTKMKNISKDMGKTGKDLSKTGKTLTKSVTAPIAGIGAASVNAAMNFEAQMSRVQAISGSTGDELAQLNKQALDLGASTKFGATEAAEGMENLASAGFTTSEIMSAMPGLLDLAASSGEDLASASDIAASTLRGFGLSAEQAGHVADVLAANAAKTNAAVADTGEAMKYIAPVASAMGLSLEEVTAAIGLMSNAGIKGSQAGTTLRGSLTRLANPSKEAYKAMAKIGFNAFDAQGKMLPLEGIISDLETATKGLTDQQKQQAIAEIFGQEAMSGMLSLIAAGPDELNKLTEAYKSSDGAAKAMADTMMNNGKGSIEQMMGSMETAGIKIGQALTPTIIKLAEIIGGLADRFAALSPEQQDFIVKMALAAAAMGPVISTVGSLTTGIGGAIGTVGKFSKAVKGGSTIIGALGTALGPGGAILLGLAAFATVAFTIYKNWDKITAAVKGAISKVKEFLGIDNKSTFTPSTSKSTTASRNIRGYTKYAKGTNYVPNDGLAYLHKGEAVVPAKYNNGNSGSSTVNHTGTVTVRGVNNRDELVAVVEQNITNNIVSGNRRIPNRTSLIPIG